MNKNNDNRNEERNLGSLRQSSLLTQTAFATSLAGSMLLSGNLHAETPKKEVTGKLADTTVVGQSDRNLKPTELGSPRYNASLKDTPKTIIVIPKKLIQLQNATTVKDALRNVPGISLQAGEGGTPAGDQLSIRGFSARTDFFVDGVRDIGGYTRDPFNIEQIEVTKGPGSTDSGRGSTGGSINLTSKTPKLETFRNLSVGIGTNSFYRTTLDINQPLPYENSAFRLNLMMNSADFAGRDVVNNTRWGIAPTIGFGIGTDTQLILSYMHMGQDNHPDYGIPWRNGRAPDVKFSNYYGLKQDYEHLQTDILTAELRHTISDDFKVRTLARYGRNHRDSYIRAPRFMRDSSSTDVRRTDIKTRYQTNTITSLLLDGNIKLQTGALQHDISAGFEYAGEKDRRRRRLDNNEASAPLADLYNPNPRDFYVTNLREYGNSVGKSDTLSAFFFDTAKLGERWTLNGGARYDHIESDYTSIDTRLGRSNFSSSQTDDILSWRSSVSYAPTEKGQIYFSYGTSVNPSAETLSIRKGAEGLDPEESETFELGTKWNLLGNRLGLSAALFRTNKSNAKTRASRADDYVLEGDVLSQGFELGVNGEVTDKFSVFAGYTYLNTKVKKSLDNYEGNVLGNSPKHSFSVWGNYELNDKIFFGGGVRYIGERSNGRTSIAPSYATVDLSATYQMSDDVSLQLNILNVADKEYIDQVGGGHFIPGEGRSAALTVKYSF